MSLLIMRQSGNVFTFKAVPLHKSADVFWPLGGATITNAIMASSPLLLVT